MQFLGQGILQIHPYAEQAFAVQGRDRHRFPVLGLPGVSFLIIYKPYIHLYILDFTWPGLEACTEYFPTSLSHRLLITLSQSANSGLFE